MAGRTKASQFHSMSIDAETVTLGAKDLMSREDGASDKLISLNGETNLALKSRDAAATLYKLSELSQGVNKNNFHDIPIKETAKKPRKRKAKRAPDGIVEQASGLDQVYHGNGEIINIKFGSGLHPYPGLTRGYDTINSK